MLTTGYLDLVSPENLSKFETQIRPDTLDAHISAFENVVVYFAPGGKTPHTYGTYCALVTAYTLMYVARSRQANVIDCGSTA
jgi:hypothetical protein